MTASVRQLGICTLVLWTGPALIFNGVRFRTFQSSTRRLFRHSSALIDVAAVATLLLFLAAIVASLTLSWSIGSVLSGGAFIGFAIAVAWAWAQTRRLGLPKPDCGCLGGLISSRVSWAAVLVPAALGLTQLSLGITDMSGSRTGQPMGWSAALAIVVAVSAGLLLVEFAHENRAKRQIWLRTVRPRADRTWL